MNFISFSNAFSFSNKGELEPLIRKDVGDDIEYKKLVRALSRKPYTIINEDWIHRSK